jgi:1-acyl-sn-glycerol-3-phosphate acyltransferase
LSVFRKTARVAGHMLSGAAQISLQFPRLQRPQRRERVQVWARGMLERLGVTLVIRGVPAGTGPLLLVANHISWLDIVVLHASCFCRFVSKSDVERWPLIGTLASGGETLYVERRSRRDALRVVRQMAEALLDGDVLAIFPEGTTGDGSSVLPFHANLLQAAISADAPVQPVALQFVEGGSEELSRAVSYLGDESLVGSIWRTLCARQLHARVTFGTPQRADGRDRRAWAADLRDEINALRTAEVAPRPGLEPLTLHE